MRGLEVVRYEKRVGGYEYELWLNASEFTVGRRSLDRATAHAHALRRVTSGKGHQCSGSVPRKIYGLI